MESDIVAESDKELSPTLNVGSSVTTGVSLGLKPTVNGPIESEVTIVSLS